MSQIVRFEKIVPEGKAMGHLKDGRAVFCVGPLPDEAAKISLTRQKRSYAESTLGEIMESSPHRTMVPEDHHMSCSPWQGVDYEYQRELKAEMLAEAMRQHYIEVPEPEFVPAPSQFNYRNKLDFTLATIDGELQLAFHQRGSWQELLALPEGCKLGHNKLNRAALALVKQLASLDIDVEPAMITVRYSFSSDEVLTILTTEAKADWSSITLDNFLVVRPLPGSGAPGKVVFKSGRERLTERIGGVDIAYPYNAFFQTNPPAFVEALKRIVMEAKGSQSIIELYSGVGAIGLPLATTGAHVRGIEIATDAVRLANRNAADNKIGSYEAVAVAAEKMDGSLLLDTDAVILDPPRAGLHRRVIDWLLEAQPKQIIYLSCNPVTQARDLALLQEKYRLKSLTGFDFYPGALHLESLAMLA